MAIKHKKEFGVYHWETFDNNTLLIGEADTISDASNIVEDKYKDRFSTSGADVVEIVDSKGNVRARYPVK